MLDKEQSLRLDLLRFPLIVGVVFIHAYDTTLGLASGRIGLAHTDAANDFVRNFISQGVARAAVPLFFLMSGHLFLAGIDLTTRHYLSKIRSRARTLLIPFLFWNIATLVFFALAQALPATQAYFSGKHAGIANYGVMDVVRAIGGLGREPIAYQFWFIRDLMILVMLTPMLLFISRRAPGPLMATLLACWLTNYWPVCMPTVEAAFFYAAGCLLADRRINLFAADRHGKAIGLAYLLVLTADTAGIGGSLGLFMHKVNILLGVMTLLYISKYFVHLRHLRSVLLPLAGSSFFVFAAHEPCLTATRKIAYKVTEPSTSNQVLALYFAIPVLVIAALVLVHKAMQHWLPTTTRLITGGR